MFYVITLNPSDGHLNVRAFRSEVNARKRLASTDITHQPVLAQGTSDSHDSLSWEADRE